MDRIAADLIIFGGSFTHLFSLSFSLWHPAPDCRKMPKSAFKLKAIHLHIFDYSINLPSVFSPHQSAAMQWNCLLLLMLVWGCVCEYSMWVKVESEKGQRCKWGLNKTELERDLCSIGKGEQDREDKTVKKSPLISGGERRQRSTDLWTACHHLNIEPSFTSTHAHTVWGLCLTVQL